MEKKFEITGPVGNADIFARIKQLHMAYLLAPPADPILELAQWKTVAEFATEAMRLDRLSKETGRTGARLFDLSAEEPQKPVISAEQARQLANARIKAEKAKRTTKNAKTEELESAIGDLLKSPIKAKWTLEDIRDFIHPKLASWPSFKGEKIWTPKTTLANIKRIAPTLRVKNLA